MKFDKLVHAKSSKNVEFIPQNLREIIYNKLPLRSEESTVIYSHWGEQFVSLSLTDLRQITSHLSAKLKSMGLKPGNTLMLASFSCSNELANALIFTAAACSGIRVFVPIFPEPFEFDNWKELTGFSHVIMPYHEIQELKGHFKEKEVISTLQTKCAENGISFLDSITDFRIPDLIFQKSGNRKTIEFIPDFPISPETELVIFTTSGTSGKSKLVAYAHQSFAYCCQSWQQAGLFAKYLFGNPGLSPLFTHTIGIRTFLNCIWAGNPFCIVNTDWFLTKPEVVRLFLIEMQIGHIIAGPAFYNTMLELFRQYPELKTAMHNSLQAAISIGSAFDDTTSAKFKSATGIRLMNGFGTTETLMISLNNPERQTSSEARGLGYLLPGVTLGLIKSEEADLYELAIHSVFQSVRTFGENDHPEFFETGDLVSFDENSGQLFFYGRKSTDFMKDEYGVKIPLKALKDYYRELYELAVWIEWIPLINIPGLAAMIFMPADPNESRQKELAALIKSTNENLKSTIEPFEYAHRHIERFTLISDEVPLTRKGTVSKDQIYKKYEPIVSELRNPYVFNQSIEVTETGDKSLLYKFSNPYMAELLEALKLDKIYIKAEGDYLSFQENGELQTVTDFVGGFGANLLGHNHPKIREALLQFLGTGSPALNSQGSQYHYPSLLAKELNRIFSKSTGKFFKVKFGNSGTEATEIAIHHAYFEWRENLEKVKDNQFQLFGAISELQVAEVWDKNMQLLEQVVPCLIVINNCFHGYTSGARSLLNNKKQRNLFSGLLKPKPLHVSDTRTDWKDQVEQYIRDHTVELQLVKAINGNYSTVPVKFSTIIASMIEPVRGEGGIYEVEPLLVDFLAKQEFPLISDEIQCGLGRTGNFPSCKKASYYLLGKSLGGGLEKISAVLIDDNRFKPIFSKYYNSTFANGELAASIGLAVLKIIDRENIAEVAQTTGEKFLDSLHKIAAKYPEIIESVNGAGLMIGIHFNPRLGNKNNMFRILLEMELLGYFFAGWFLNNHRIRVLPSLSKPNSLRIEPSYRLPETEINKFCKALDELCGLCTTGKMYELFRFLMNGDLYPDKKHRILDGCFPQQLELTEAGSLEVGFIGNFTLSHLELQVIEPDFLKASDTGLRILFNRFQVLLQGKPIKIFSKNLLNGKIHFSFYILPFDTSHLEVISRWGKKKFYIRKIQDAVDFLSREGAQCVSLGAHTSIITGNGLTLAERRNCPILTGNSLTVASCLYHLNRYLSTSDIRQHTVKTIAIAGAGGNIGTGLVDCLNDPKYAPFELVLVGNNEKRLQLLCESLKSNHIQATGTGDLFDLKRADVIICCANTSDPIIFKHHLSEAKPVLVIDLSVPSAVSDELRKMENVIFCNEAASVYLHHNPDLSISSHTPAGKIFCCAGETILYALHHLNLPMKGHIQKDSVYTLMALAEKEGFFNQPQHETNL
jgi:acetylornithine/succinyldiaminopimelate/putrescine aminotransferase/predicted amino acid dehydrogenase/acyl-coenzyme A synthetase/AMP-(fatty) acid ligase